MQCFVTLCLRLTIFLVALTSSHRFTVSQVSVLSTYKVCVIIIRLFAFHCKLCSCCGASYAQMQNVARLTLDVLSSVAGSSLERRHESREWRCNVWPSSAWSSKPQQLVRLPGNPARPTLYAVQAAHCTWCAQAALHVQQLHDGWWLVLSHPPAVTTATLSTTRTSLLFSSLFWNLFLCFSVLFSIPVLSNLVFPVSLSKISIQFIAAIQFLHPPPAFKMLRLHQFANCCKITCIRLVFIKTSWTMK